LQEAAYIYDGDGNMVKAKVNDVVTYYPGRHYNEEVDNSVSTVKKFYTLGSTTVAVRTISGTEDVLNWVLGDHYGAQRSTPVAQRRGPGSASVTANADGSWNSELKYTAFGEVRTSSGLTPTEYRYTGQLEAAELGLYFYVARWYDPYLNQFVQPDTIIPEPANAANWNRYAYTNYNSINYSDPDGHCPILIGAGIGALAGGIIYGATSIAHGRDFSWADFGTSVAVGAAGGALIGTGVGASAGVIGSQFGYSAVSGKKFDREELILTSTIGGVTGAATGVLGAPAGINPISNPALAFGARLAVNGISGGVEFGLSEVMDGKSPTVDGLKISVGIGLTAGLAGEAFPGYQSQTLKTFGNTP
jgi:RHS repeat-associated protein